MSTAQEVKSVRVQILGEEHIVRGQASEEYIKALAASVNERMVEVQKSNPLLPRYRVAILVALNLLNELEKLRAEHEELLALMEEAK
ncbi:MAG: cell division protein ZapA [Limnochordia bacterium]|nr:cell division protein ZapA [Limnochordia bacterium]MDI9464083.1 cell division protein ZapA [Bacillota bacterium]NLO96165.1 cell division protein ZapA [Bacillota bacterium]HAI52582.1 cell division protein ZapA [Bacillota bacterium]HAN95559.1 cell division protein ZapA [Bacillota bacterium]